MAPSVRKCGPQNDHVERSDMAKRFFIAGWERERAKTAKRATSCLINTHLFFKKINVSIGT
jgi:hypothetical protein